MKIKLTILIAFLYLGSAFAAGHITKAQKEKKLGDLGWIEYRDLKKGSEAFKEIHNGTCIAPKIILIP